MNLDRVYRLHTGVQVRREAFGLLFYDYRGPRLYFLPTRELLSEHFFDGVQPLTEVARTIQSRHRWPRPKIDKFLVQTMNQLETKGLVHGQSIC